MASKLKKHLKRAKARMDRHAQAVAELKSLDQLWGASGSRKTNRSTRIPTDGMTCKKPAYKDPVSG